MADSLGNRLKQRWEDFEQFTIDVIYERRRGGYVQAYASFLRPLSWIFSWVVQMRLLLFDQNILRRRHLGCLVVVVGNLTVGGTGKTPVVEKFARSLAQRGRKVGILSRGYKSKKEPLPATLWRLISHGEAPPPKVVSDGRQVLLDSERAGDEPYMLARNLPGVIVIVDKNRVKAGLYAIRKFGVDTLILDDGFQYLALKEQLNLLLIDKTNPFGNHALLPRGVLREPVKHIRRASYVFLTKSNGEQDDDLVRLIKKHKPDADIIECTHEPKYLQEVGGDTRLSLTRLNGLRIGAFSGIATPESFEGFLQRYSCEVVVLRRFLDHHRYQPSELQSLFKRAQKSGLDMVVTTEKDAVRIWPGYQPGMPFYYLRVEIEIIDGVDDFEEAVSRICFPKKDMAPTRPPFQRLSSGAAKVGDISG